ncbi:hypothetical protein L6E12_28425 [Actinokineospora sp. PR83]|uniref:hypothetical protein n=1 Tax=Actinokineospora sp. PR83 TaxID=2884908 RepID=UPI001F2EBC26|nr:hypothetical protein [Actinokineospora sp. PR83]MCG8919707.1 hypothetical protein [Actinokineospora sp. PR83]
MSYARRERLARWASGGLFQWRAVWAVGQLARELTRPHPAPVAASLVHIAAGAPGPAAERALRVLSETTDELFAEVAYQCLLQTDVDKRVWTSVAAPVLFTRATGTRHRPRVRLVHLLDQDPTGQQRVVDALMGCVSSDSPRRASLIRFLSVTDQPVVLDALAAAWRRSHLPSDLVTEVVMANQHVTPRDAGDTLLAVAKDRLDLLDHDRAGTADTLLKGLRLPGLADKYRRALRTLRPGAARERVCEHARWLYNEGDEARAAAIDAGYLPEGGRDRVLFLYLTEQWELYDAADPGGDVLYDVWVANRPGLSHQISDIARRTGRPDPRTRWETAHPLSERPATPSTPRIGGVSGAWGVGGGGFGGFHA